MHVHWLSTTSQVCPLKQTPLKTQAGKPADSQTGSVVVVLVDGQVVSVVPPSVVDDPDDVVVVVVAQPPSVHASQQLGSSPTQKDPPFGALHLAALLLIEQLVLPLFVVRQQVTKPGLPQVERAAQRRTKREQLRLARTAFSCPAAQLT